MWKLLDFSVTQILREIKVCEFRVSEFAILAHLEALNLQFHEFLHFLKTEIYLKSKFKGSKYVKMTVFELLKLAKIHFT